MSTNTEDHTDQADSELRQLVAEMVALTPPVEQLAAKRVGASGNPDAPDYQGMFARKPVLMAAAVIIVAVVGGWLLTQPDPSTVATEVATSDQPYRWEAIFPDLDFAMDGAVTPSTDWARFRMQADGGVVEFIYDGEVVGSRFEGNGAVVALDESQAEELAGKWLLIEEGPLEEFESIFDDAPTLESFDIDLWEDLGSLDIDGEATQHLRTNATPGVEVLDDLSDLVETAATRWDGQLDVWAREDGHIARIALYREQDGELVESVRVNFFDFGIPIDTTWPDGAPPTERFEESLEERAEPDPPLEAVFTDGVSDVFDLMLSSGERFRLSLPAGMGNDLVLQTPTSNGIRLEGPQLQLAIDYGFCAASNGLTINPLGMEVGAVDMGEVDFAGSIACRSDELISMMIDSQVPMTQADLALVDLRPIFTAGEYREALIGLWPELGGCGNCSPWGPMNFPDENIVVNRTGQTAFTAVALDSLEEVWSVDTGGFGSAMHAGDDAIYLSDPAGPFVKIAAASGEQLWSIDIADEHSAHVSRHSSGGLLLATSFGTEGDNRAPLLRWIDDLTGEVLWTASGRESAEWQFTMPVVLDGLAIVIDVYDNPAAPTGGPGAVLHAFDMETGAVVWTTELVSSPSAFSSGLLFVADLEEGQALIVRTVDGDILRVDPSTGAILWRAEIGALAIDGTDLDSGGSLTISIITSGGPALLSPISGEVVS